MKNILGFKRCYLSVINNNWFMLLLYKLVFGCGICCLRTVESLFKC